MFSRIASLVFWFGLSTTVFGQGLETAPGDKELNARIGQLIGQLGVDEFADREAATNELLEIGNLARTALEQAAQSPDPETAYRAKAILERLPKLTHTVVDALGAPIQRAKVTVRLVKRLPAGETTEVVIPPPITVIADDLGRVAIPEYPLAAFSALATIEHSDYGLARCAIELDGRVTTIQLPLVRSGTEASARALTGQVVDADGKPVAGASIHCENVRTPGEGLIYGSNPRGESLSDRNGRFAFYLPNTNRERERGELIPPNSRYAVRVSVPGDDSFFPLAGQYANTSPVRLELPRATRFFRFRFESAGGGMVSDVEQLGRIRVQGERIQGGERMLVGLDQAVASKGCKLPEGKYLAELFTNGNVVHYQPLTVTADSADELIFRLPPATTYRGRAVDGITNEPMQDVFIMGWNSTARNNLALLTAEDWKSLRELSSNPPLDDPGLRRLREFYGVQGLVRTDSDGQFEIIRQSNREFYGLLAFAEDFVPFKVRVGSLTPDDKQTVDAGDFPLFPAAKVLVRPVFDGPRLSVSPAWLFAEQGQPDWFDRFRAAGKGSEREFEYVHWLTLNELQPVFVPAGVNLQLRFETPYDDQWTPAVTKESVQLKQGTTHEVGNVHFAASLPAVVRVVNQNGNPVEGLPVRRKYTDGDGWSIAHNTDQDGQAYFYLHPNSQGQFRVSDLDRILATGKASNLLVEFAVTENAPTENFPITVTEEQIQLLRGEQK